MKRALVLLLILPLGACGLQLPFSNGGGDDQLTPDEVPIPFDTTGVDLEADEDATAAPATGVLGTTLATLGDATVGGLWIETPFVTAVGPGRVTSDTGTTLELELRPSGGEPGSGSRLSLAAMQALGLSLTAIAEVSVEAL